MGLDIVGLILSLAIILIFCEVFTNGIEWLGKKLKVGDGVVGSIFSAVGTCLPETTIPVVALLFSKDMSPSTDIGVGAIIGAPFMLCTFAFFITGMSVLIFAKKRRYGVSMNVNGKIFKRDMGFFIVNYSLGVLASFISIAYVRKLVGVLLIACYFYYIILTVKNDKHEHGKLEKLYFQKYLNLKPSLLVISLQVLAALTGIVFGADLFIDNIRTLSDCLGISPLVLSLVITPVATELPEKFNSVIWIRKGKDTLAIGNITGAMVFQSCIPVSIGIFVTPWQLDMKLIINALLAILSGTMNFLWMAVKRKTSPAPLIFSGFFYAVFVCFLLFIRLGG